MTASVAVSEVNTGEDARLIHVFERRGKAVERAGDAEQHVGRHTEMCVLAKLVREDGRRRPDSPIQTPPVDLKYRKNRVDGGRAYLPSHGTCDPDRSSVAVRSLNGIPGPSCISF